LRGRHDHHPPYPTKLPRNIADEVVQMIRAQECLDLTARMFHTCKAYAYLIFDIGRFILSPKFAGLCRKHGESSLNTLHQSLNIEDRIAALIRKQKLLVYPEGSSLAGEYEFTIFHAHAKYMLEPGVLREYTFDRLQDSDKQWIHKIHFFDEDHFLVICCTYAQAKAFVQVQCMEMDLSFKMIQGKTNVFSICGWNEDTKRKLNTCVAYAGLLIYM